MAKEQTQKVIQIFREISAVPRGSYHTEKIREYVKKWAAARKLPCYEDGAGNILIKKQGSAGQETKPPILLQGHMDMVCVKEPGSKHNFETEGIEILEKDGYLTANGTTLGADNGIGMAMAMYFLDDPEAVHPPLEVLFTTDEEVGLIGARNLDPKALPITAKTLLNLDSGWDGVFIVGCAGGGNVELTLPLKNVTTPQGTEKCYEIRISGLTGGHSGAEIQLGRANAIVTMGRVLTALSVEHRVSSIHGGELDNVIAQECVVRVLCAEGEILKQQIAGMREQLQHEFAQTDPHLELEVTETEAEEAGSSEATGRLEALLTLLPNGVLARDEELGLVLTSTNVGRIRTTEEGIKVYCMPRSSVPGHFESLVMPKFKALMNLLGGSVRGEGFYSGWEYNRESEIVPKALAAYQKVTGHCGEARALHAGLECGILMEKLGKMDAVSFGPADPGAHSVNESLNLASLDTTVAMMVELLK